MGRCTGFISRLSQFPLGEKLTAERLGVSFTGTVYGSGDAFPAWLIILPSKPRRQGSKKKEFLGEAVKKIVFVPLHGTSGEVSVTLYRLGENITSKRGEAAPYSTDLENSTSGFAPKRQKAALVQVIHNLKNTKGFF